MKPAARIASLASTLVLLMACVTETTGVPEPASKEDRLAAQINLARGYLESADPGRARGPLERALEIDSGSADALGLLAVFYQQEGEIKLAEDYYRRALRSDPRHAPNLNNYAALLYSQGRYQEALDPLRRLVAITSYRGRAQAYESLGLTELRAGSRQKAREAFEQALRLTPEMSGSALELAELAFNDGDNVAASRYYEQYRSRERQTPRSLCLGIDLARAVGDADQRASYEIVLRNMYPDAPETARCTSGR